MKKVLCYTENYLPGGGNRYLVDVVNNLPQDWSITLVSNKKGIFADDLKQIKRPYVYRIIDIWSMPNLKSNLRLEKRSFIIRTIANTALEKLSYFILLACSHYNKKNLYNFLKENKPDLVICFNGGYPGGLSCLDLIIVSSNLKIFNILSVVSMPRRVTLLEICLYKEIKRLINLMLVNAERIKNDLVKRRKFSTDKIKVINTTVHLDLSNIFPERFLQIININPLNKPKIIGYIGRIEFNKGIFHLVQAFSKVVEDLENIKLVLVGTGVGLDKVRKLIKQLRIENDVIMAGFYDYNIAEALSSFDIFVFPSLWEGFPYSIIEAMAVGKIIISTNVGGITEAIENGREGILVPPGDTNLLASKMKEVISNLEHYQYLGINAKDKINNQFSMQVFKEKVNTVISTVIR